MSGQSNSRHSGASRVNSSAAFPLTQAPWTSAVPYQCLRTHEILFGFYLCRMAPRVTMVKSTQMRHRHQLRVRSWLRLDRPAVRGVLRQSVVNAILLVVAHVVAHQPPEMCFVQCDDMVQDLSPATSDPALRQTILPGCLHARPFGLKSRRLPKREHFAGKAWRSSWITQSAVGCRVTLKCRILLRPRSMTKKQYGSW